jgi:diaminopimelate decarboxylase
LNIEALSTQVLPIIAALKAEAAFAQTDCVLEMGRWIVGPAGWLLTSVIGEKESRGVSIRTCDAGFNNHLAACGMMGSVIRRNWRFANLSNPNENTGKYTLVGPLCTTIDTLATDLELPETHSGDVIAVESSGAYGLTASPTRFISHPEPREALIEGGKVRDVTESSLNHWRWTENRAVPMAANAD